MPLGHIAIEITGRPAPRVIAAASTADKRRFAIRFGADAALDYTGERWRDELNELTSSGSVDDSEHPVSWARGDEMSGCAELAREADIAHSSEPIRAL
ncbi:hypothetical protein EAS61_00340 [Bradyrhizobium zhanjiangense]|uniref:Alcohol dehydrogenase-like C-terminal domain-containing protein n=1 Tax=Bradyrhizobium zhanjiangense TaxID=1325107 RepID=A0A4V1KXP8_9BRAD|nr:hypothetical protein EAS61_00340 [Bradyrhizobium zhanjiangense]